MFFKKKISSPIVVYTYPEACDLLKKSGVNIANRKSSAHLNKSSIITVNGMSWLFSGNSEGFAVSRTIYAPESWDEDNFYSWQRRKNCASAFYNQQDANFIIVTHILSDGGVVLQNLGRLVLHFGSTINDFLETMGIDEDYLKPLE